MTFEEAKREIDAVDVGRDVDVDAILARIRQRIAEEAAAERAAAALASNEQSGWLRRGLARIRRRP